MHSLIFGVSKDWLQGVARLEVITMSKLTRLTLIIQTDSCVVLDCCKLFNES